MSKKLSASIFGFLLFLFIAYSAYYFTKSPTQKLVPIDALSCQADTDCVLFSPDCEDCKFEAVHKSQLAEFRSRKELECSKNPPKIMCDAFFDGEIKCLNNTCSIIP